MPSLGLGGLASWVGSATIEMIRGRSTRRAAASSAKAQIDKQRDDLMLSLLTAAQGQARAAAEEAKASRIEAAGLRMLEPKLAAAEARLVTFEEALGHIRTLLETPDGPDRREAERHASAFLIRMARLGTATGTLMNEIQRLASAEAMRHRGDTSCPSTI